MVLRAQSRLEDLQLSQIVKLKLGRYHTSVIRGDSVCVWLCLTAVYKPHLHVTLKCFLHHRFAAVGSSCRCRHETCAGVLLCYLSFHHRSQQTSVCLCGSSVFFSALTSNRAFNIAPPLQALTSFSLFKQAATFSCFIPAFFLTRDVDATLFKKSHRHRLCSVIGRNSGKHRAFLFRYLIIWYANGFYFLFTWLCFSSVQCGNV